MTESKRKEKRGKKKGGKKGLKERESDPLQGNRKVKVVLVSCFIYMYIYLCVCDRERDLKRKKSDIQYLLLYQGTLRQSKYPLGLSKLAAKLSHGLD